MVFLCHEVHQVPSHTSGQCRHRWGLRISSSGGVVDKVRCSSEKTLLNNLLWKQTHSQFWNVLDFMQSVMAPTSTAAPWVEKADCKAWEQPCEGEAEPQIIKQLRPRGIKNSLTLGHSSPVWMQSSSHISSLPLRLWNLFYMYQAASLPSSEVWIWNNPLSCIYTAAQLHVRARECRSHVLSQKDPTSSCMLPWWSSPPFLMQIHQGKEGTLVVNGQSWHEKNWVHE